ncbi:MAG TPA: ATP-binding protein [Thermomicrobiaceae bacterium]|nr:ATP-binding protein [Thermomicrobiaceae bacterium]
MAVSLAAPSRSKPWFWLGWLVPAWCVALVALTAAILWVPSLAFAYPDPPRAAALETFMVLVATMVAFVGLARFAIDREPLDLAIAVAFAGFALARTWFILVPLLVVVTPTELGPAPLYSWIVVRLSAGLLLLLALSRRGRAWITRAGFRLLAGLVVVAGLNAWLTANHTVLPALRAAPAAPSTGDVPVSLAGLSWPVVAVQVAIGLLYAVIAWRLFRDRSTPAQLWLPLALSTAAVAELHFAVYPTPFDATVTTSSDLLWLVAYAFLLTYLGHQYLRTATLVRRQQRRSAALLHLSQTQVAARDRGRVLAAIGLATRAVDVPSRLVLQAGDTGPAGGTVRRYPIADAGTVYGWIAATPRRPADLPPDVDEYLRIVTSQAASLLRAIDLYGELTDAAVREERMQLARELHDGLAQDLAVLRFELQEAERSDPQPSIERALAEARYLVTVLHGDDAAPSDFLAAFRRQAEDLADRFACPVDVACQGVVGAIPPTIQVAFLRIAREAVINAGKHAAASHITVRLAECGERLELVVSDDGHGFDPSAPRPRERFGLRGIGQRVATIGGEWALESQPGQGTVVRVTVRRSAEEVRG